MARLLELAEVSAGYGEAVVLDGISLALDAGSTLAVLGRNGMGKTTLIRTMLAHVKPTRGEVRVHGRDCTGARPDAIARCGIAYVPEGRGIFPNLSVRENLQLAARPGARGSAWTLDRVLDVFPRLRERLGHGGQQLSGGEQQMLALARALMSRPRVLLLDEPSLGLAPKVIEAVFGFVRTIREEGTAIVLVEQNARLALETADRAIVMQRGRVALEGPARELAHDPRVRDVYLGRRETSVTPDTAQPNLESEER